MDKEEPGNVELLRGDGETLEAEPFAREMVTLSRRDQIGRAEPERLSASRLALDAALIKATWAALRELPVKRRSG